MSTCQESMDEDSIPRPEYEEILSNENSSESEPGFWEGREQQRLTCVSRAPEQELSISVSAPPACSTPTLHTSNTQDKTNHEVPEEVVEEYEISYDETDENFEEVDDEADEEQENEETLENHVDSSHTDTAEQCKVDPLKISVASITGRSCTPPTEVGTSTMVQATGQARPVVNTIQMMPATEIKRSSEDESKTSREASPRDEDLECSTPPPKISREFVALKKAFTESKVLSEFVNETERSRKSRKMPLKSDDFNGDGEREKIKVCRGRSKSCTRTTVRPGSRLNNSAPQKWPSDEKLNCKRENMRSQNTDFVQKQMKFLNRVKHDQAGDDLVSDTSDGDQSLNESNKTPCSVESKNDCWQPPPKRGADSFCWKCKKCADLIACSKCPRSFHFRCIKICTSTRLDKSWICPECTQLESCINGPKKGKKENLPIDMLNQLLLFALKRMKQIKGSEKLLDVPSVEECPLYTQYVANPVTLNSIQEKIERKFFRCTEEFVLETKWIQHNVSIAYTAYSSKYALIAKTLLKVCRQEAAEIEVCAECYLNANTRRDWFIDVCLKPHILLWAKLKGFPYWPAKGMGLGPNSLVNVRFFGDHDRAFVPVKDCYLYSESDPNPNSGKRSFRPGIAGCIKEVDIHIEKIREKIGGFRYALAKTPYDPSHEMSQLEEMMPGVTEYIKRQQALQKPPLTYKIVKTAGNISIIKKPDSGTDSDHSSLGAAEKRSKSHKSSTDVRKSLSTGDVRKSYDSLNSQSPKPSTQVTKLASNKPMSLNYEVVAKPAGKDENNSSKINSVILKRKSDINILAPTIKKSKSAEDNQLHEPSRSPASPSVKSDADDEVKPEVPAKRSRSSPTDGKLLVPNTALSPLAGESGDAEKMEPEDAQESPQEIPKSEQLPSVEKSQDVRSKQHDVTVQQSQQPSQNLNHQQQLEVQQSQQQQQQSQLQQQQAQQNTPHQNNLEPQNSRKQQKSQRKHEQSQNIQLEQGQALQMNVQPQNLQQNSQAQNYQQQVLRQQNLKQQQILLQQQSLQKRLNLQQKQDQQQTLQEKQPQTPEATSASKEAVEQSNAMVKLYHRQCVTIKKVGKKQGSVTSFFATEDPGPIIEDRSRRSISQQSPAAKPTPPPALAAKSSTPTAKSTCVPSTTVVSKTNQGNSSRSRWTVPAPMQVNNHPIPFDEIKLEKPDDDLLTKSTSPTSKPDENVSATHKSKKSFNNPPPLLVDPDLVKKETISDDDSSMNSPQSLDNPSTANRSVSKHPEPPRVVGETMIQRIVVRSLESLTLQPPTMKMTEPYCQMTVNSNANSNSQPQTTTAQPKKQNPRARKSFPNRGPNASSAMLPPDVNRSLTKNSMVYIPGDSQNNSVPIHPLTAVSKTVNHSQSNANGTSASTAPTSTATQGACSPATTSSPPTVSTPSVVCMSSSSPSSMSPMSTPTTQTSPTLTNSTNEMISMDTDMTSSDQYQQNYISSLKTLSPLQLAPPSDTRLEDEASRKEAECGEGHILGGLVTPGLAAAITDTIVRGPPKLTPRPEGALRSNGCYGFNSNAGPVSKALFNNAHKMTDFFIAVIQDTISDMANADVLSAKIMELQMELEAKTADYEKRLDELQQNSDRMLCEMKKNMEAERIRLVSETRKQCEMDRAQFVAEVKKRQWCAKCSREAKAYCCWNTAYCNNECQMLDWVRHSPNCTQSGRDPNQQGPGVLFYPGASTVTTPANKISCTTGSMVSSHPGHPGHPGHPTHSGHSAHPGHATQTNNTNHPYPIYRPGMTTLPPLHMAPPLPQGPPPPLHRAPPPPPPTQIPQLSPPPASPTSPVGPTIISICPQPPSASQPVHKNGGPTATIITNNTGGTIDVSFRGKEVLKLPPSTYLRPLPPNMRLPGPSVHRFSVPLPVSAPGMPYTLVNREGGWEVMSTHHQTSPTIVQTVCTGAHSFQPQPRMVATVTTNAGSPGPMRPHPM